MGRPEAPVVVVLGGISAGRHVTATAEHPAVGWWDAIVGPGRAIDTQRYRVLGLDWLGGSGASTGPRPREAFPLLASQDQALALHHLLDELAAPRVERIVGASFGGMVALAFAERFASRVRALTVISAAHESHPLAMTTYRATSIRAHPWPPGRCGAGWLPSNLANLDCDGSRKSRCKGGGLTSARFAD